MINLILLAAFSCPTTIIINETKIWNDMDVWAFNLDSKRCVYYFPDSPCLKKFIKKEENDYWAICGK